MFDTIFLSPHLDDAALSCGGRIARDTATGKKVLIVTVMAGDPEVEPISDFVRQLHDRWQLAQDATAVRRAEDREACHRLRAEFLHLQVPDCIYRLHPESGQPLYPTWQHVVGEVHPFEHKLIEQLADQFLTLPAHQQIVGPLALGSHVDHQIVRRAAEHCFGTDLIYYEDYPYVNNEGALTAVIPSHSPTWQAALIPLAEADIQTKINAIAAYRSQLSTFFDGRVDLEKQITDFTNKKGGEQYWRNKIL